MPSLNKMKLMLKNLIKIDQNVKSITKAKEREKKL